MFDRARVVTAAVLAVGVVAGCASGPSYTYIESEDGHMFAKIPAGWEVTREGAVDYTLITKDNLVQFAFTPGDTTMPWRADFNAEGMTDDAPVGFVESQHLDARVREEFRLGSFIDDQRNTYDDYERTDLRRDGLVGYRVRFTIPGDEPLEFHEAWFMDERRSAVYRAAVSCSPECTDRYGREIDDILLTFTVEP